MQLLVLMRFQVVTLFFGDINVIVTL